MTDERLAAARARLERARAEYAAAETAYAEATLAGTDGEARRAGVELADADQELHLATIQTAILATTDEGNDR